MRSCNDCVYLKTYINRRKMEELKTKDVIFISFCDHGETTCKAIEDFNMAADCLHFSDDDWVK